MTTTAKKADALAQFFERWVNDEATKLRRTMEGRALCAEHHKEHDDWLWLSDRPKDKATAAALCLECPVIDDCRRLADLVKPTRGVWAGVDMTDTRKRKRSTR